MCAFPAARGTAKGGSGRERRGGLGVRRSGTLSSGASVVGSDFGRRRVSVRSWSGEIHFSAEQVRRWPSGGGAIGRKWKIRPALLLLKVGEDSLDSFVGALVAQIKLGEDAIDVFSHGRRCDLKIIGDGRVGLPLCHECEHF